MMFLKIGKGEASCPIETLLALFDQDGQLLLVQDSQGRWMLPVVPEFNSIPDERMLNQQKEMPHLDWQVEPTKHVYTECVSREGVCVERRLYLARWEELIPLHDGALPPKGFRWVNDPDETSALVLDEDERRQIEVLDRYLNETDVEELRGYIT